MPNFLNWQQKCGKNLVLFQWNVTHLKLWPGES